MAYAYEKLITQHKLNVNDLPEEVKIAIDSLKDIEKGINLAKSRAKKIDKEYKQSALITSKIKQLDSWAIRGINESLEGTIVKGQAPVTDDQILKLIADENAIPAAIPATPIVVVPAAVQVATATTEPSPKPHEIDIELLELHKIKVESLSFDELKSKAPKSYAIIFESYKKDEENGIETSNFTLLETENNIYKLSKK